MCLNNRHKECMEPDSCLCSVQSNHNLPSIRREILTELERPQSLVSLMEDHGRQQGLRFDNKSKIDSVAKILIHYFHFCTIRQTQELLIYTGKIYDNEVAETTIKVFAERLIPDCTSRERNECIEKIKAQTQVDISKFDDDVRFVVVENGIIDLESVELLPHSPTHYSRILIPMRYEKPESLDIEKNLENTEFWKFLKRSHTQATWNDDGNFVTGETNKENMMTLLEIMASVFIRQHIDDKAFIFIGNGENGKSVFINYLQTMIGKRNNCNITLQEIGADKFLTAELDSKILNTFPDLKNDELKGVGKIKQIISGESFRAQRKHGQPFDLKPMAKLLFSCNQFPAIKDRDKSFFRRWIIVQWARNFESDPEKIPNLKEKIIENYDEMCKVFSNVIWISRQLWKSGKFSFSQDSYLVRKIWLDNSNPLENFIQKYTKKTNNFVYPVRSMWEFYRDIMIEKGLVPFGIIQFNRSFAEYYDQGRDNKERVWINVDITFPEDNKIESGFDEFLQ